MDKIMASDWEIKRYDGSMREEWNDFVRSSRNGTFLFEREYMDYHADRFEDCSLLAYRDGKLSAVLPANIDGDTLASHGGLTYGGWVLPKGKIDGAAQFHLWEEWLRWCRDASIRRIDYKAMPFIYSSQPSEEDRYLLYRFGATIGEVNLSTCIDQRNPGHFNTLQRRHLKKGLALGVKVWETDDVATFMTMIGECLSERHGAQSVHSIGEMQKLKQLFPDNIRFFVCGRDSLIEGGVCVYVSDMVAHCQYIGTTASGREGNVLSVLFDELINRTFREIPYFDFGTSNERHGEYLNEGLLRQKFSLGGSGVSYPRYSLTL